MLTNRTPSTKPEMKDAIVVGTGLAGLSTTLRLLKNGFKVTLVEKTDRFGGNSIKASSGINGVPTIYQLGGDSIESFRKDTLASGKGLSNEDLVDVLTENSRSAIEWLTGTEFNIDLSRVTQLGGHSFARTHRGNGRLPPGFAIILALQKRLLEYPALELTILKNARLHKLLLKNRNTVSGIEYVANEERKQLLAGNVVLATGGFSADSVLLKQFRPDLLSYPLTNGVQTTGDGQKIAARDVDAKLIDMDQVQVHPTGFLKMDAWDDKFKFLCGELIRGIGGILISPADGKRFVNELETRDNVTAAIIDKCPDSVGLIVVNEKDYQKAASHIDFYVSLGLLHKGNIRNLVELVNKKLNTNLVGGSVLDTFATYDSNIQTETDSFKRSLFGSTFSDSENYYFGFITPVVHFSMGGIAINTQAQVISNDDTTITNLFAVGEVSGGLHGANRLGGSSLLECVVFSKVVSDTISDASR